MSNLLQWLFDKPAAGQGDVFAALDIGTSKIMSVVAEVQSDSTLKVLGLGVSSSSGMKRGVVVNIEACVQSIQQAIREAELMAACKITRVITGITGSHIRGRNSVGMVAVRDREVTPADVAKVLETARAINISTDQRPLLVEPQEFIIDGQEVMEPIGMSGIRLESKVHIVTCAQSAAENIIKCVRRCGLEVEQLNHRRGWQGAGIQNAAHAAPPAGTVRLSACGRAAARLR